MKAAQVSSTQAVLLIGKGVLIETLRRNDLYVILLLAAIYVLGAGVALMVGIENQSTVNFLLNLGITFAWFASHLLVLLTIARQVPDEQETRTLHPLLAKPISRFHYLFGKWLFAVVAGLLAFLILLALSMTPWLVAPEKPSLDGTLFLQSLILSPFSLMLMGSLGLLGSLVFPKPVNIVLLVLVLSFGQKAAQFLRARSSESLWEVPVRWVTGYMPEFSKLNLFDRYTDGMSAISSGTMLGLIVYSLLYATVALAISEYLFRRRWL